MEGPEAISGRVGIKQILGVPDRHWNHLVWSRGVNFEEKMRRKQTPSPTSDNVAGNGLVDRRLFLAGSAAGVAFPGPAAAGELAVEPWMKTPGAPFVPYGQPSRFEDKVVRVGAAPPNAPGTGATRTPLHLLNGAITPNGLHFERSHSGVP